MNDILNTYMERFRENRHTLRRYTAFVLALAMITTLFVNWQLHGVGISMTAQYQCGEEEHTHTADCYTKVLTCGYEEGELENAAEVAAAEADQPSAEENIMPLSLEPQTTGSPSGRPVAAAADAGLVSLKGHRIAGGMRASIYNAMPREGVEKLVNFMADFEKTI